MDFIYMEIMYINAYYFYGLYFQGLCTLYLMLKCHCVQNILICIMNPQVTFVCQVKSVIQEATVWCWTSQHTRCHSHWVRRWSKYALLRIVCADLTPLGIPTLDKLHSCLYLVVLTSNYNSHVPVLIGTNIIQNLIDTTREEFGSRFLQDVAMHIHPGT